jgi:hypothetical protein
LEVKVLPMKTKKQVTDYAKANADEIISKFREDMKAQ